MPCLQGGVRSTGNDDTGLKGCDRESLHTRGLLGRGIQCSLGRTGKAAREEEGEQKFCPKVREGVIKAKCQVRRSRNVSGRGTRNSMYKAPKS